MSFLYPEQTPTDVSQGREGWWGWQVSGGTRGVTRGLSHVVNKFTEQSRENWFYVTKMSPDFPLWDPAVQLIRENC